MKKPIVLCFLSLVFGFSFSPLWAASFEGVVVCQMTVNSPGVEINKPVNVYYKGSKVRMDLNLNGQDQSYTLADYSKETMFMVYPKSKTYENLGWSDELMGGKEGETVTKTGKTKKILGKTCVEWVYQGGSETAHVWVASGMGSSPNFTEDGIWGAALAGKDLFSLKGTITLQKESGNVVTTMEATKIEAKPLKDSLFALPTDSQPKSTASVKSQFTPFELHDAWRDHGWYHDGIQMLSSQQMAAVIDPLGDAQASQMIHSAMDKEAWGYGLLWGGVVVSCLSPVGLLLDIPPKNSTNGLGDQDINLGPLFIILGVGTVGWVTGMLLVFDQFDASNNAINRYNYVVQQDKNLSLMFLPNTNQPGLAFTQRF